MFCSSRATQAHLLAVLTVFSSSCGIVKGKIWDPVIGQAPACKEIQSSVRWGLAIRHKEKGTRTKSLTNTIKQTHRSSCCYRYIRTEKLNTARSTRYTKLGNQRHHNIHTMHFCTKNQNEQKWYHSVIYFCYSQNSNKRKQKTSRNHFVIYFVGHKTETIFFFKQNNCVINLAPTFVLFHKTEKKKENNPTQVTQRVCLQRTKS